MPVSSLISNVSSESQSQANLLTNTPDLVKVLVEDEEDVVVWYRFLKTFAPRYDFDISPYSYDPTLRGKGKANVLKMSPNFGVNFLGCVDSDYDWLLENWTQAGKQIKGNRHILQTYAYSIENLAAQPYGDSDWMMECVMHSSAMQRELDRDYSDFIASISTNVYELLIWHLLMWRNGIDEEVISAGWEYVFGNDCYRDILSDHALSEEGKRTAIKYRFGTLACQRVRFYNVLYYYLIRKRRIFKDEMTAGYGLSPENAYLFVRGHNLHDFLMHCFFEPCRKTLIEEHKNEIMAHNQGGDRQNPINHYMKQLKEYKRNHLHKTAYIEDSANTLTKRIQSDIAIALSPNPNVTKLS